MKNQSGHKPSFIFFGTPDRGVIVLDRMKDQGLIPVAIVTAPDKPVGRKQLLTETEVSAWAGQHNIPTFKPSDKSELGELESVLSDFKADFFIVVAYGYIIPNNILKIPKYESLNVHYSLLPKYRGASPVVQQVLHGVDPVGFTIIRLVKKLDAGPVYYTEKFAMPEPLPTTGQLAKLMSEKSGDILPTILDQIITDEVKPVDQDDSLATSCGKLSKTDGLIDLSTNQLRNWHIIQAMQPWPKSYFEITKDNKVTRVVINEANYTDDQLQISNVTPAGKKPMSWQNFTHWLGYDPLEN